MSYKRYLVPYYQLYQTIYGFIFRAQAEKWELLYRNAQKVECALKGCAYEDYPAGPMFHKVTPVLTAKVEVYELQFGKLHYTGVSDFQPGFFYKPWTGVFRIVASLRVGGYSAEWYSEYFGAPDGYLDSLTVSEKELLDWAKGEIKRWEDEALNAMFEWTERIWDAHVAFGVPVPEGVPESAVESLYGRHYRLTWQLGQRIYDSMANGHMEELEPDIVRFRTMVANYTHEERAATILREIEWLYAMSIGGALAVIRDNGSNIQDLRYYLQGYLANYLP